MKERIKSFVLRNGRISPRQQKGLDDLLPHFILSPNKTSFSMILNQNPDVVVEIGFGMGDSLVSMAANHPHIHFIGIEVHQAGIGSICANLHEKNIKNVSIAPFDAVTVLSDYIEPSSLSGVQIFFPDPWPKKKHHKRRLIQPEFVRLLVEKIKPGGFLHCATDWEDYAQHMMNVLHNNPNLIGGQCEKPEQRPLTKFEQRGQRLGHQIWDFYFKKLSD